MKKPIGSLIRQRLQNDQIITNQQLFLVLIQQHPELNPQWLRVKICHVRSRINRRRGTFGSSKRSCGETSAGT